MVKQPRRSKASFAAQAVNWIRTLTTETEEVVVSIECQALCQGVEERRGAEVVRRRLDQFLRTRSGSCLSARVSGTEFVVRMPKASREEVRELLEALQGDLQRLGRQVTLETTGMNQLAADRACSRLDHQMTLLAALRSSTCLN